MADSNSAALSMNTLLAVSDDYIVISNRFLRFFSLFDHAGNPIVHITMERPDSPLPEYAPGQLTSGFAYLTGDIVVDGARMILWYAGFPRSLVIAHSQQWGNRTRAGSRHCCSSCANPTDSLRLECGHSVRSGPS